MICANPACKKSFTPKRKDNKYHSPKCGNAHWCAIHPRIKSPKVKKTPENAAISTQ